MQTTLQFWSEFQLGSTRAEIPSDFRGELHVGSGDDNDIVVPNRLFPERAFTLQCTHTDKWTVESHTEKTCLLDDERVERARVRPLNHGDTLRLPPYAFLLKLASEHPKAAKPDWNLRVAKFIGDVHLELVEEMNIDLTRSMSSSNEHLVLEVEHSIERIAVSHRLESSPDLVSELAKLNIEQRVLSALWCSPKTTCLDTHTWETMVTTLPDMEMKLERISTRIRNELNQKSGNASELQAEFQSVWEQQEADIMFDLLLYAAVSEIKKQTKDTVFGYGPLEDLLRMPSVSEIMVVRSDLIYIEQDGVVKDSGRRFTSDLVTETIIKRIVEMVGKTIDRSRPMVDARLKDGSRVNAVIEPIALGGPTLTIRKFPTNRLTMAQLVTEKKALSEMAAMFLKAAVEASKNIIVSGGTGTGKTTLLNCLSEYIPDGDRIITIEDTAELQLSKQHVVRMETKPANAEGAGEYSIQSLLKNALRMRPDRIVVGECRGPEALDMLQAMNTGHDGSLTTIHANNPFDVQLRLEVLVRMATELPVDAIHRQIASAVDLVVQLQRVDGARTISHITEIVGIDHRRNCVRTRDLFRTDIGEDGSPVLLPTGNLPTFIDQLVQRGFDLEVFFR